MVQSLPSSDAFAAPLFAAAPAHLGDYFGCEPEAGTWGPAWLHRGYSIPVLSFRVAACSYSDGAATARTEPRAFLHRRSFAVDGGARAVSQLAQFANVMPGGAITAENSYLAHLRWSVLARVTTGTLTDATLFEARWINITGYELLVRTSGTALVFELVRYKAGSASAVIASHTFAGLAALTDFRAPLGLALELTNVAADVQMRAYVGPLLISGAIVESYQLFQEGLGTVVLSSGVTNSNGTLTDAHADKITAAGHAGFGLARDRTVTTITPNAPVVDLCSVFQIFTGAYSSPTWQVEDRWQRSAEAGQTITDSFGVVGTSLQQAWTLDLFASSSGARDLDWNTASARAEWTASSAVDERRAFVNQRPAADSRNQRKSVVLHFETGGTAPDSAQAGVLLRATAPTETGSVYAYASFLEVVYAGPTYKVRLARITGTGITVIAEASVAAFTGADKTLDFEVYLHEDSPVVDGPAILKVLLDAVQVVLVPVAGVTGVSATGGGTVTDFSADRIVEGPGEGIWARNQSTLGNARKVRIDTWAQQSTTAGSLAPALQATVALDGEGTAAGSLNSVLRPGFPFEVVPERVVLRDEFDSGHVRHAPSFTRGRSFYRFTNPAMQADEALLLQAFWDDHLGAEIPFSWTPFGSSAAIKAKFVEASLAIDPVLRRAGAMQAYRVSFELEELTA